MMNNFQSVLPRRDSLGQIQFDALNSYDEVTDFYANCPQTQTEYTETFDYPKPRRDNTVDEHFGVRVADPYQWMEKDSEELKGFIKQENGIFQEYVDGSFMMENIKKPLSKARVTSMPSRPIYHGAHYYSFEGQKVYRQQTLDEEKELYHESDLNTYHYEISGDEEKVAYSFRKTYGDTILIKIWDHEKNQDFPETLERVKFTNICWAYQDKGIFYSHYVADPVDSSNNKGMAVSYHRLNTVQSEDIVLFKGTDPNHIILADISSDCRVLFIRVFGGGLDSQFYFIDLPTDLTGAKGKPEPKPIYEKFGTKFTYIAYAKRIVTLLTNHEAPKFKLMNVNLDNPNQSQWIDLIAQDNNGTISKVYPIGEDKLLIKYLRNAHACMELYTLSTGMKISDVKLPLGDVTEVHGSDGSEVYMKVTNPLVPGDMYVYDCDSPDTAPKLVEKAKTNVDMSNFEYKTVFCKSKDETCVPIFITCPKDMPMDGSTPCLIQTYGGFGHVLGKSYETPICVFIKHFNAMFAFVGVRGGGEYGSTWHEDGTLGKKQNTFDDFQYAAEYLQKKKYTSPSKTIVNGRSNGGLVSLVCCNQRPDLYGVAIISCGISDMLRVLRSSPFGAAWTGEFGNPDEEADFITLYKYSPLHNIQATGEYPAMLFVVCQDDTRLYPWQTYKFVATIQHLLRDATQQRKPLMMKAPVRGGHGRGMSVTGRWQDFAEIFTFIHRALCLNWSISEEEASEED